MSITLPSQLLETAQMTETEMLIEIAIMLYQQRRTSLEKAAKLIPMTNDDFYQLLVERNIVSLSGDSDDSDDESNELILASFNTSLQQVEEGKIRPISELWDGIDV